MLPPPSSPVRLLGRVCSAQCALPQSLLRCMWRADAPPLPPPPPPPQPLLAPPASPPLPPPRQPEPTMAETSATAGSAIVVLLVGLGGGAALALWWGRRCRAREREGDGVAQVGAWDESCREGTPPGGDPLDSLPVLRGAALAEQGGALHEPPSRSREGPLVLMQHPPLR